MTINSVNSSNSADAIYGLIQQTSAGAAASSTDTALKEEEDVVELSGKKPADQIAAMKDDLNKNVDVLRQMVQALLQKQGGYAQGAGADFLLKVDKETQEWAQAQIAEDGYWGVDKTAERILNFAKTISGGDSSKIDLLRDAVLQGFNEAEKIWGGKLPDISQKTIDKVMEGFKEWENGGVSA